VTIDLKDDYPIVVQPIPGTPAARIGVRAGDRITEIDGISANKMPLQEAVARIRGPKGSAVHLVIRRGDQSMRVTIVRDRIEIVAGEGTETDSLDDAARARLRDAGIGYVRLVTFNDNTEMAFRRLFERAKQTQGRALFLDLRGKVGVAWDCYVRMCVWVLRGVRT